MGTRCAHRFQFPPCQTGHRAIILADERGAIVGWNKSAEQIFGYSEDEIIGQPLTWLMPERYRSMHQNGLDRFTRSGESRVIGQVLELEGLHKDGTEFPLELSLTSWQIEEGRFYGGMIQDISQRKEAEKLLRLSRERLRELSRKVIFAQEEERRRLSRDLHDSAGQFLTALKIRLSLLADDIAEDDALREGVADALMLASKAHEEIRAASHALRPPALEMVDLNQTLKSLSQEFARQTDLPIDYLGTDLPPLPDQVSISFYRALQEALTNVAKHAQATRIKVTLDYANGQLALSVADNGVGFASPPGQLDSLNWRGGVGLLGLTERFELLGGDLIVSSQPGTGTRVAAHYTVDLPQHAS